MRYLLTCVAVALALTGCGANSDSTPPTTDPTFQTMWGAWTLMADTDRDATCASFTDDPAPVIDRAIAAGPAGMTRDGVADFLDAFCEPAN